MLNILFMMVVYIWLMYSMHLISCLLPMQRRSTSGAGVIASGLGLLVPPVRINIFVCSLTFFCFVFSFPPGRVFSVCKKPGSI
jgi:hypothetical protein